MNDKPTRWQLYTAANPTVERIIPDLAKEIGLNESIVLMQISFWIGQSTNVRDGIYWTYHSIREMHKTYFPYWSTATIWRTINSLKDKGYILVRDDLNKREGDNTQWFALEPDKLSTLVSVLVAPALEGVSKRNTLFQNETPPFQNETTLPEITPETTHRKEKITRKSATAKELKQAMIDAWFMAMGFDAFDIGADRYFKSRMDCASRMLKWSIPPTDDEIRTYCEKRKAATPQYEFTWLEKDLSTERLAVVKQKTSEPRGKTKVEQSAELQRMMMAEAKGEVWHG